MKTPVLSEPAGFERVVIRVGVRRNAAFRGVATAIETIRGEVLIVAPDHETLARYAVHLLDGKPIDAGLFKPIGVVSREALDELTCKP